MSSKRSGFGHREWSAYGDAEEKAAAKTDYSGLVAGLVPHISQPGTGIYNHLLCAIPSSSTRRDEEENLIELSHVEWYWW